jgi:hypothetical protein
MTPMVAEKSRSNAATAAAAPATAVASAAPAAPRPRRVAPPRPTYAENQDFYRPDAYRRQQTFFPFQSLFGGRW